MKRAKRVLGSAARLAGRVRDKVQRHQERAVSLGHPIVLADSIEALRPEHWDAIAEPGAAGGTARDAAGVSVFMRRHYLRGIEAFSPANARPRYGVAYVAGRPAVLVACQVAEVTGTQVMPSATAGKSGKAGRIQRKVAKHFSERVLVCGNLVSSGLHGVAFAPGLDEELGWRLVSEMLYRIRRAEKLGGSIDFVMIKDLKGKKLAASEVVERYSYRRIQTDPDMVLELKPKHTGFEAFLADLNTKYRSRTKKVAQSVEEAGYACALVPLGKAEAHGKAWHEALDARLHALYLEVEGRSPVRLATLPRGYFLAMGRALGEDFDCWVIRRKGGKEDASHADVVGFITVVRDGETAVAYYVGFDYGVNAERPLYFRLLQLAIESGLRWGCRTISFGRTAAEPKANLGAKPVDAYVWVRHRLPLVNFMVRQLFAAIPYEEAPERNIFKEERAS